MRKKTFLTPLRSLGILVKNQLTIHIRVYLWSLWSTPLVYIFVLVTSMQCFYYNFVASFEIRKCLATSLLSFKIIVAVWSSWRYHV